MYRTYSYFFCGRSLCYFQVCWTQRQSLLHVRKNAQRKFTFKLSHTELSTYVMTHSYVRWYIVLFCRQLDRKFRTPTEFEGTSLFRETNFKILSWGFLTN